MASADLSEKTLRELFDLRDVVDELIEEGLVHRWSVSEVIGALMPRVTELLQAHGAFFETYGEDLKLTLFVSGDGKPLAIPGKADVWARTTEEKRERVTQKHEKNLVVAQHIDVAGEWFGRAGIVAAPDADPVRLAEGLNVVCEVLDNYLFSIKAMREKHLVMMRLGNALRHRVLGEGVKEAVKVLSEAIPVNRLVIVYRAEEGAAKSLHIQMFEGAELKVDTLANDDESYSTLQMLGRDYLAGTGGEEMLKELGVQDAQEEVLINGITKSVVVGKVVVTASRGTFNTYDRELLAAFAGFIRQRIVDFSKEWRSLAYSFRPTDVARLLQSDDYEQKYLAPREENVAILYVDIAGFTRISEQILKVPSKVAQLVETWSRDAVDILWMHGGVFDKMVGDCIIGLFGPPFYDESEGDRLKRAIECARDIRAMTTKLPERPGFEILKENGVAVSTGVNLCPLFVGQFGPNSNFTGFSSGMNNTARLQGCATKDEVLVMESAILKLPANHRFEFSDERSAPVKNVAEPLKFRALK